MASVRTETGIALLKREGQPDERIGRVSIFVETKRDIYAVHVYEQRERPIYSHNCVEVTALPYTPSTKHLLANLDLATLRRAARQTRERYEAGNIPACHAEDADDRPIGQRT